MVIFRDWDFPRLNYGNGMKIGNFIWKGVKHYRASYLGVLLGAAVGAMVLLGALMAGDSVKGTLEEAAIFRTGKVDTLFTAGERFFEEGLAERNGGAALLYLKGQVNVDQRAEGKVQVLGIDASFWKFAPNPPKELIEFKDDQMAISETLANSLDLELGSSLVVRLQKPGLLSRDAPLSGEGETVVAIRGTVSQIVSDDHFGRFSLEGTQVAPSSVFIPRERLQKALDLPKKANLLLLGEGKDFDPNSMTLADYSITVEQVPGGVAVRSARIFIGPPLEDALSKKLPVERVATYLVNTLETEVGETPYSMVTAVDPRAADFLPADLKEDEIVINEWLAEDLSAGPGDEVTLHYYSVEQGSQLVEKKSSFTVRTVIPMTGAAADKRWMPDFPGVADVKSSRDWEPGLPLDLKRIRDKDDDYWEKYKGTPKAFVSYAAGKGMWSNRWGNTTGLRVIDGKKTEVEAAVESVLSPSLVGMQTQNFKTQALTAARSPVDFAMLFLSMSFFLILASVALVVMLFTFNVEQRIREGGLLTALGIKAKKVTNWRLEEAFFVVLLGGILGVVLAVGFCFVVLKVIGSIWESNTFSLHLKSLTIIGGLVAFISINLLAVWWSLRKQAKRSASIRMSNGAEEEMGGSKKKGLAFMIIGALMVFGAVAIGFTAGPQGAFFLGGFGLLFIGLGIFRKRLTKTHSLDELDSSALAKVNLSRRATRSLTVVGVLAAGAFLVLSVTAFRKNGGTNWQEQSSGAGGYAWWVETTNPVNRPADSEGEVAWFNLPTEGVVPFRIGAGDNVDCFNLNSTGQPQILAVDSKKLTDRFRTSNPWNDLTSSGDISAFVDETTMMWVLKKKIGDTLTYQDEWGDDFTIRIAGVVKDSIFQGSIILDESVFLKKYPSAGGYSLFLVSNQDAKETLQKATADLGGKVTSTQDRLAAFHEVENTYIAIFHVLGGLGIVLGSIGVGVVTARNLIERRSEFSLLKTLGLARAQRSQIVMKEARTLITWGLGIGLISSMLAVLPLLGKKVSFLDLGWMLGLLLIMGLVATASAVLAREKSGVLDTSDELPG
ncbi:FtsX-like permease family protein [Akkermansiaceae bacterium]|nr:FtsX-like permease family protein [Akkermansiaceae bacterium]